MSYSRSVTGLQSLLVALFILSGCQAPAPVPGVLDGPWRPMVYRLKSGESHRVDGSIFFDEGRWLVLFYVLGDDGEPVRGAAEGGSYTTSGNRLSLSHLYNLSSGESQPGLEESPLRRILRPEGKGEPEECTFEIDRNRLTIHFPSGNTMDFIRFSK